MNTTNAVTIEITLADYNVAERAATAEDVRMGYASEVGDPLWIDVETGALIG